MVDMTADRDAQDVAREVLVAHTLLSPSQAAEAVGDLRQNGLALIPATELARLREIEAASKWRRQGIYIASKTRHAEKWRRLRSLGHPIVSTWIDEAGEGESASLSDLWVRCIRESSQCRMLLLYVEPGDVLKGAHAEAGVALSHGIPVHYVGPPDLFSMLNHPLVSRFDTIDAALPSPPQDVAS